MPIYICEQCDKIFDKRSTYDYHVLKKKKQCVKKNVAATTTHVMPKFQCPTCNNYLATRSSFGSHVAHFCPALTHKIDCGKQVTSTNKGDVSENKDTVSNSSTKIVAIIEDSDMDQKIDIDKELESEGDRRTEMDKEIEREGNSDRSTDNEIVRVGNKYKCPNCQELFDSTVKLDRHSKLHCDKISKCIKIYDLDPDTYGTHLFKSDKNAGNVYIMRPDRECRDVYKVGKTADLYSRISTYHTGYLSEPRLLFYMPCKDLSVVDHTIKKSLRNYFDNREFYSGPLTDIANTLLKAITNLNATDTKIYEPRLKENSIVECRFCQKLFLNHYDLERHTENYHSSNPTAATSSKSTTATSSKPTIAPLSKPTMAPLPKPTAAILSDNELQCRYCDKIYTRKDNLARHINKFCRKKVEDDKKDIIIQQLLQQVEQQKKRDQEQTNRDRERDRLTRQQAKELKNLKKEILKSGNKTINNTNNTNNSHNTNNVNTNNVTTNTQNNNNINFKLIGFGKEDMHEIIADDVCVRMFNHGYQCVPELIQYVHFNEQNPDRQNVYISNIKTNDAIAFDGESWNRTDSVELIKDLVGEKHDFLSSKFKELKDNHKLDPKKFEKFEQFNNDKNRDSAARLYRDTKYMLYNKRKITMATKRKMEESHKANVLLVQ